MKLQETYKVIKKFRDYVIQQSRSNLSKGRRNVSKDLYNSLNGEIVQENNYAIIGFRMNEYGMYLDQGVKGKKSSAKAPNSPFKFGSNSGVKGGLTRGIDKWVRARKIQFRDYKTGKFISYKSTAYIISRSIYMTGMKPSLFFTKPFEAGYKKYLNKELLKAYGLDIDTLIDYNISKINEDN